MRSTPPYACTLIATLVLGISACATVTQNAIGGVARVETDSLSAKSLGRRVAYNVVLPAGYGSSGKRYPILWLLHGYGGGKDDWLQRTDLLREIERYPFVVVLPSADNSWYVNAPSDSTAAYEDFVTIDLYSAVVQRFAIDTLRQAIAGLSMGGYGAVMLGLRHPHRYRFAGGLSAALSVASSMGKADSVLWRGTGKSIIKAFGVRGVGSTSEYDPLRIFRHVPADSLPYIFLAIGTRDGYPSFLPSNRAFTDSLRMYGARYEYHETPGTHSWIFWQSELRPMLERAWEMVNADSSGHK